MILRASVNWVLGGAREWEQHRKSRSHRKWADQWICNSQKFVDSVWQRRKNIMQLEIGIFLLNNCLEWCFLPIFFPERKRKQRDPCCGSNLVRVRHHDVFLHHLEDSWKSWGRKQMGNTGLTGLHLWYLEMKVVSCDPLISLKRLSICVCMYIDTAKCAWNGHKAEKQDLLWTDEESGNEIAKSQEWLLASGMVF